MLGFGRAFFFGVTLDFRMLTYLEYAPLLKPSQALKTHFNTSKIDRADIFWGVCFFLYFCSKEVVSR